MRMRCSSRSLPIVLLSRVFTNFSLENVLSGKQLDTGIVTPIFNNINKLGKTVLRSAEQKSLKTQSKLEEFCQLLDISCIFSSKLESLEFISDSLLSLKDEHGCR